MSAPGPTVLRDAIWGDISLGPRELALIDTPAFQRLRRVRQLGFTDLVFPGARHTRFEHSLGVFHLAGLVLERLAHVPEAPTPDEESRRCFLAAALLHDVGHYPFSHAIEELEVEQVRSHTDIARDLVVTGDLARVIVEEWDVPPERVAMLVAGPRASEGPLTEMDVLLRTALDSGLDVDKLDYLVRDARGANVPYGVVDVQRLVGSLTVFRSDDEVRLAVEAKGIASLQSLVFAKHLMFATVYWHHACRAGVVMLLRGVQEALRSGALAPEALERADDAGLTAMLASADMPQRTRDLSAALVERRLYKRAEEIGVDDPSFAGLERLWFRPAQRAVLEDGWAAVSGSAPGSVLLDIPEPKRITVDLPVVVEDGRAEAWDHVSGLGVADLDRFQRWVRRLRVFAETPELAQRVRDGGVVRG